MPFHRQWDSTCPRVWDRWEADGTTWVVQDLEPEDDEEALRLLLEQLAPDEVLCIASDMVKDEESMRSMGGFWRVCLAQRTSLACYAEENGVRTLAALNCCIVPCAGEEGDLPPIEGEAWTNVYEALKYAESRVDTFKLLGVDKMLYGMGLVVRREYRGAKLGSKLLAAREPLCKAFGLKGTSTVFTGVPSQKSAIRAGFTTVAEVTMRELAQVGLKYPPEDKVIKTMIKKYEY